MKFYKSILKAYYGIPEKIQPYVWPLIFPLVNKQWTDDELFGSLYKNRYQRQEYFYCVYQAANLAQLLGFNKISVLEMGVGRGCGVQILEKCAEIISKKTKVNIEIYGFDTGGGLPSPKDYRDLPYIWQEGFYKMDIQELKKTLHTAKLVIGNIEDTSETFFNDYNPAPIGAVIFDMDFYSSTKAALSLFKHNEQNYYLPRVFTYFDDILGNSLDLFNDYTGERLAINEFNTSYSDRKLSPAYYLLASKTVKYWYHQIFILHLFQHEKYNNFIKEM